ncbi:DUF975 family protein [Cohnella suwonensis]|uniref:DUF975 family protein n=1 Tax=Cohnella suwonensis TaxID=696072 RepID=A0ABW0LR64_9BACL
MSWIVVTALGAVPFLGSILALIFTGAINYGLADFSLRIARNEPLNVGDVFSGFQRLGRTFMLYLLMNIFIFLWTLLLLIPGLIAYLRYSMSYFILKDNPELFASEAIRRSKQLMYGHKWRYFVLNLTFIGWALLGVLTCFVGYLWLLPYIRVTQAHFYEDLIRGDAKLPEPPAPDTFIPSN